MRLSFRVARPLAPLVHLALAVVSMTACAAGHDRLPAPAPPPATVQEPKKDISMDKVQSVLRAQIDQQPAATHRVYVRFAGAVTAEALAALGLREVEPGIGRGQFDGAGIAKLAERSDVTRIEAIPEMRPSDQ